ALLVKLASPTRVAHTGSARREPAPIPVPRHGVTETLGEADCRAPEIARGLALGPGAPVGMQNLAGFLRSEHGCAAQYLCSGETDRGGGPDSRSRQWDDESLGVHGCFNGPDNLIPRIALGALIRQLEHGTGRTLVA